MQHFYIFQKKLVLFRHEVALKTRIDNHPIVC